MNPSMKRRLVTISNGRNGGSPSGRLRWPSFSGGVEGWSTLTRLRAQPWLALIVAFALAGVASAQGLYALEFDDYAQQSPVGVDRFFCLQDVSGRTAALPDEGAAVLSVDAGLFSDDGRVEKNQLEPRFERLLENFQNLSKGSVAGRVKLLLFPQRPHLTPFHGLSGQQVAALRRRGLQDDVLLECPESASKRLAERIIPSASLYLLENRRVRYRYLRYPDQLPEDPEFARDIMDVVGQDLRSFLRGRTPRHAPVPLLDLNVEVPDELQNLAGEKAFLLLSFGGLEAEAPAKDRMIVREREGPLGGNSAVPGFESGHPGAAGRRVIERLTPLLAKYDLAAVGLVKDSDRVDAMRRAFPGWSFVDVGTAEAYLTYWEALNSAYFVSGGRTRHAFAITPFNLGFGEPFESLLRRWLR